MKKILLLMGSLLVLHSLNAGNHFGKPMGRYDDEEDRKFSFSFNGGVGLPQLDFAKRAPFSLNDSSHAFGDANSGFHFDIGVSYRFIKYLGVAARLGGTISSFDAAGYGVANNIGPNNTISANGSHFISEYLLGPLFRLPVTDIFSIEAKVLVGRVAASYPDISIQSTLPNNYTGSMYKYATAKDFGYNVSIGGRLRIDDLIWIVADVSYTASKLQYGGLVWGNTMANGYQTTGISLSDRNMSLGIVCITAGFAICF